MSNFSVRLHFTLMQGIIITCTMYLIYLCPSIEEVRQLFGNDASITYMITRYDHESGKYHDYLYYENFNNYEELCEKYSEPDRVIDYSSFSLCIWEDGIQIIE